jgi:hypothetical protein
MKGRLFHTRGLLAAMAIGVASLAASAQGVAMVHENPELPAAFPTCTQSAEEYRKACNGKRIPDYIAKRLRVPSGLPDSLLSRPVVVAVVIDTSGVMGDIRLLQGVHPAMDEEALRIVRGMQSEGKAWKPARVRGMVVHSEFRIEVPFARSAPQARRMEAPAASDRP